VPFVPNPRWPGGRSSASEDERGTEIIRGSTEFFLFGASNIAVNSVNGVCVLRKRERETESRPGAGVELMFVARIIVIS
jgi:hypothetical protein